VRGSGERSVFSPRSKSCGTRRGRLARAPPARLRRPSSPRRAVDPVTPPPPAPPRACPVPSPHKSAVKCIRKDRLTKEDLDALTVEVKAMEMLKDHPNFVKYYDFFSEK
jgi:hypothetical protein